MSRYPETYEEWQNDPGAFWGEAAKAIDWFEPAKTVFNLDLGIYGRWFDGAVCNTCWNCVDRHVEAGHGERAALLYDSPVTGTHRVYSFADLQTEVGALASVLRANGIEKGDRVIIYMPMVPEAVFSMLACARLGAIHSVVFGGFAASELATRINDATPKMVISASCGIEGSRIIAYKPLLGEAIGQATAKPKSCLILQRPQLGCELVEGRDLDYAQTVGAARTNGMTTECVPIAATDPLYILYTSGTTGQPKGVVRGNGGHMVALRWTMEHHYGVKPGEVFWAASDVGWVVGHSYICYAPLLHRAGSVLYEGKPVGTPDAGAFWRVIQDNKVVALFTAPTAFRTVRKKDLEGRLIADYDLGHFRILFLAGERADPDTIKWAEAKLDRPVIDHWWQTETGWAIAGNPVGLGVMPVKLGSPGLPMPGYDIRVLDDDGKPVAAGDLGNIVVRLPLPPSCLPTLWNAEARCRSAYFEAFPGYYATSDAGFIDEDGYAFMARTDDIINVAGHRLSTGAMEEVIASHPDIAECAVIGVADALKGHLPVGLYAPNDGVDRGEAEMTRELIGLVREKIGPVAAFKTAIEVKRLPKTRSVKILRGTVKKIADSEPWKMPAAIDDPEILNEIAAALKQQGYAQGGRAEPT